jgi:hypothetical protein
MIERIFRACLTGRRRWRVVIFLTLALGFLVLWPQVDSYFALREQSLHLRAELQEVEGAVARLDALERRNAQQRQELAKLEATCVPPERLTVFRGEMVELARQTMCQVHRIHAGESQQRPWRKGDHPLAQERSPAAPAEGNYRLHTQVITLTVSGKLAQVREFLGRLLGRDAMVCASRFLLRPSETDPSEAILELECRLFDLGVEAPKSASRS